MHVTVPLVPAAYAPTLSPVAGAAVVGVEAVGEAVVAGLEEGKAGLLREEGDWPEQVPGAQLMADWLHTCPEPHGVTKVLPLEHCTNLVQSHGSV